MQIQSAEVRNTGPHDTTQGTKHIHHHGTIKEEEEEGG